MNDKGKASLETRWSVAEIQAAVVRHTGNDVAVPNVSWGFFDRMECDLVSVTSEAYIHEFEIKRSWGDFLADFRKARFHDDVRIARLTYVLPAAFACDRLRKFCEERYATFKRAFDFLFYREDECAIVKPVYIPTDDHRTRFDFPEQYRTSTYLTDAMLEVVNANDATRPYRRRLFTEELMKLYRLGVIRLWHRTRDAEKAHEKGGEQE